MLRKISVLALIVLLLGFSAMPLGAQEPQASLEALRTQVARLQAQVGELRGREVYRAECATCHGLNGNGAGPGAQGFAQRPTDFTKGAYKLRSTTGKVPEPGDLERTIREGMSGTEMVPFKHVLTERNIALVAEYIRQFAPPPAAQDSDEPKAKRVVIPTERPFPASAETVAEGKALYKEHECAECHGEAGKGAKDETDDWEFPLVMLSFQLGYYKSGTTDQDLYRSTATGMHGTSMEGYSEEASAEDLWKLVDYVRSLSEEGDWYSFFASERPSGFDYSAY